MILEEDMRIINTNSHKGGMLNLNDLVLHVHVYFNDCIFSLTIVNTFSYRYSIPRFSNF